MAQDSWPSPAHNAREVTDAEYEKIASRFSDDGIYGSPADAAVVSAGAGLSVDVRAEVRGSLRGHAWYSGATTVNLTIAANASGQTRVDRIVLRLDRSTWTVRAVVKQGTPGAGVPSLTQSVGDTGTYEIAIAEATLLSGAGTVTVTRKELYVGTRHRACTSTTRNPVPHPGETCFETDTGRVRLWTGSAWVIVFDDSGTIDIDTAVPNWTVSVGSTLESRNGSVHVRLGTWERTGATLPGATNSRLPLLIPAAYRHPTRNQYAIAYITGARIGRITIYPANVAEAGQVWLTQKPDIAAAQAVLPGNVSWTVG